MRSVSRGAVAMMGATVAFTAMVALVRLARTEFAMDAVVLVMWRCLLALPVALLVVRTSGSMRITARGWMALRCALGFFAMMSHFSAARYIGVGELSVLFKLQPIFIGVIAPLVLGRTERPGSSTVLAIAMGLLGCTILIGPDLGSLGTGERPLGVLWALSAALFSAAAHTCLRALGRTEDPRVVVFWFQNGTLVLALGWMALFSTESAVLPQTWTQFAVLLGIGLCALTGQLLMTEAYRVDQAAKVAGATYIGPLIGFSIDVLAFAMWPTPLTAVGATVVLGAGWLVLRGQQPNASDAVSRQEDSVELVENEQ